MLHPLEQKIAVLRRRMRRMVLLYGLSAVATAVLACMVLLGLVDYFVRLRDPGLRIIATLAVLGMSVWAAYRYLFVAWKMRLGNVDLAARVERRFPHFDERLLSAVQFLHQSEDDATAGSAALRRAVIAQTTAESEPLDFDEALDHRPARRAAMLFAAVCMAAGLLVVLDPLSSRTAVARLLNPLGSTGWPQKTHLAVRRPVDRVARCQTFEIEVFDDQGGRLPSDARILYRIEGPDGAMTEESERMRFADGALLARRENVLRPFAYRVEGGDDRSMPWTAVDVVDPPAVASLAIRLVPPAYTGWPSEPSGRHIRALVGTRIEFAGRATKPLESASLLFEGGRKFPAQVSDDGFEFTLPAPGATPIEVEKSGAYWLELTDSEGLQGGSDDRWEIRAVPDGPPTVVVEQPTANLFVTPQAVVPLRVSAKDDIALRSITLVFSRVRPAGEKLEQKQEEKSLTLFTGPEKPPAPPAAATASAGSATGEGDRRVVDYRWELRPLELSPGMQLNFWAAAADYKPQNGKSEPRQLIVITPQELQDRVTGRQHLILAELQRALKMQRGSRAQAEALTIRLGEVGRVEQNDIDQFETLQLGQREVNQLLTSRGEGLPMHILALLAELENNRIDSADAQRCMEGLLAEIERLDRELLTPIGRELTIALKTAQIARDETNGAAPKADQVTAPLAAAGKHQEQVVAALETMVGQLARWDNYRRFHRELTQLLHDQEEVAKRTSEVGRRTLARELRDLSPRDSAELKIAAGRQAELARLLDRTLQDMDQAGAELQTNDPAAAETVADALDEARRLAISGQMRAAAAQVGQNQIGQAVAGQKQIAQDLQEVLDILANRRQHELARLVKKLRDAETDLSAIEQRQAGVRQQLHEGNQLPSETARRDALNKAAEEQKAIQRETELLARRLERLQAEAAARATQQAAGRMGEAGRNLDQNAGDAAAQRAAEAETLLAEARRQLAEQRRQAAVELAMEQLARLEDTVKHLHRQQQNALDETKRLRGLEQSQGELTRAQAIALRDLARLQRSLQTDAAALAQQLAGAGAFQMAMTGAAGDMDRAAALLDRRELGAETQQAQQDALRRLALLLEALKPEEPEANGSDGGDGGQGGPQGAPANAAVLSLSELKLIKLLQQEVNLRTEELQRAVGPDGKPDEPQRQRLKLLAEEQGRLADMLLQLLQPVKQEPEEEGDKHGRDNSRRADRGRLAADGTSARDSWPTFRRPLNVVGAAPIDDELRRELGGAASPEEEASNPILTIARRMRDAQTRIDQSDAGRETQDIQLQVVADLERLLQQAKKNAKQCKSGSNQPRPPSSRTPIGQPKPGGGQKPSNKPATESGPRPPDGSQARKPSPDEMRSLMKQLWGELPEHAREQMLQSPVEEFPPKYQELIEEYFRRLSEEKGGER